MFAIEEIQTLGFFINLFFAIVVVTANNQNTFKRKEQNLIYNKSRWMLVAALAILSSHYLLQRTMGFRHMGGEQAALVNTMFYVPAIILINLSILNLLYFGQLKSWHIRMSWSIIGVVFAIHLAVGLVADGGLMGDGPLVRAAQYVSSVTASAMLIVFNIDERHRYNVVSQAIDNYYDSPRESLIRWFVISVGLFAILAIITPAIIYFDSHATLIIYGVFAFSAISSVVINFLRSVNEETIFLVMEAVKESSQDPEPTSLIPPLSRHGRLPKLEPSILNPQSAAPDPLIHEKVQAWLHNGRHLRAGITAAEIAAEMGISYKELKFYIQSRNHPKIGSWLAVHRIEEAKRLLRRHSEYSHDAIAEMCGFASRQYFQTSFRNIVGMPPMQWQKENVWE